MPKYSSGSARAHPYRRPGSSLGEQPASRFSTLISYAAAPLKWGASLFVAAEDADEEEAQGAPAPPSPRAQTRPEPAACARCARHPFSGDCPRPLPSAPAVRGS